MHKVLLLSADGSHTEGDERLIERWRSSPGSRLWLDIEGECTPEVLALLRQLDCDELAITDCFRSRHPPKVEHFERNSFLLFRGISHLDEDLELEPQQIGLWVGDDYLISVHRGLSVSIAHFWANESSETLLDKPNELALRLIHYASGRYLEKLLNFEEHLAELEDSLLSDQSENEMKELVGYRSRLRKLRRIFNYHQRMAENIWQSGSDFLGSGDDDSQHLRRDVFDRCERCYSLCTMYYEICGDLIEGYISMSSHKLNNTMKILTIITAIFVPLGFLAGLYGMNFEYMPELAFRYSYFILLGVMATLVIGMVTLFRRFRWL
jgi:magnesium transporter